MMLFTIYLSIIKPKHTIEKMTNFRIKFRS